MELLKGIYGSGTYLAHFDFMTIPGVAILYERHKILISQRIIDAVQIENCHHEHGGLRLKLGTFLGVNSIPDLVKATSKMIIY